MEAAQSFSFTMDDVIGHKFQDCEPLSSASLWGDEEFADATIVMGDCTWKVHRWVLCKQSRYFMKAFQGAFKEGIDKKIDLTGNAFSTDQVNGLLGFLYNKDDKNLSGINFLQAYDLADYFQVDLLRYRSLRRLRHYFLDNAERRFWQNYGTVALKVIKKYATGEPQKVLVEVTAKHIHSIMWDTGSMIWDKLKAAQPEFVEHVLKARCPKLESARECHLLQPDERAAARADQAFDEILPLRSRSNGSRRRIPSVRTAP